MLRCVSTLKAVSTVHATTLAMKWCTTVNHVKVSRMSNLCPATSCSSCIIEKISFLTTWPQISMNVNKKMNVM